MEEEEFRAVCKELEGLWVCTGAGAGAGFIQKGKSQQAWRT